MGESFSLTRQNTMIDTHARESKETLRNTDLQFNHECMYIGITKIGIALLPSVNPWLRMDGQNPIKEHIP